MSSIPWLLIAIAVLLVILAIIAIFATRKKKHEPDYRTFFIMGIIFIPLGFATDNSFFWIVGIAFIAIGLVNKDKWKKRKPRK